MKHFINLKDISKSDLRKIIIDAKKRKEKRKNFSTLDVDKDNPLKGKLLIQMFEKSSLRTRLSFYLAIKQLGGAALTLRPDELHLAKGGESIEDTAVTGEFRNIWSEKEILILKTIVEYIISLEGSLDKQMYLSVLEKILLIKEEKVNMYIQNISTSY